MVSISKATLGNQLILAPLAGYSNLPFRLLCREHGAGLCVSEMISCHGLVYRQPRTIAMLASCPSDRPVSFQLFGSDASVMGDAAAYLTTFNPDIIDINMGCPVRKVTKKGAGAALMTDIRLAESIIAQVVSNSSVPVTVKIRSGPDSLTQNATEFARMAEVNGVSGLVVHGRSWKQAFSGRADWDVVKRVKDSVSIPVIGNGDLTSYEEAQQKISASGCDGAMIGRAAIGNPWIFSQQGRPKNIQGITRSVIRHLELYEEHSEADSLNLAPIRNHLGRYYRGFPQCSGIRQQIFGMAEFESLKGFLYSLSAK